jgi:hypothetical protein
LKAGTGPGFNGSKKLTGLGGIGDGIQFLVDGGHAIFHPSSLLFFVEIYYLKY